MDHLHLRGISAGRSGGVPPKTSRNAAALPTSLPKFPTRLRKMPRTMKWLALVQFFTWLGLFCMWLHFSNAVPVVFGTTIRIRPFSKRARNGPASVTPLKDAVTFVAAFALMAAASRFDRRTIHSICLTLGALGLLSIGFIHGEAQKNLLLLALGLGGVAWASILSMPYAMLAGALPPQRMGVYMGIFNFFIVLPEIIAALTFGPLVKNYLGGNLVHAVMAGGVFMLIAAVITLFVPYTQNCEPTTARDRRGGRHDANPDAARNPDRFGVSIGACAAQRWKHALSFTTFFLYAAAAPALFADKALPKQTVTGADGASITISLSNGALVLVYRAPQLIQDHNRVYLALGLHGETGSAVLPFERETGRLNRFPSV